MSAASADDTKLVPISDQLLFEICEQLTTYLILLDREERGFKVWDHDLLFTPSASVLGELSRLTSVRTITQYYPLTLVKEINRGKLYWFVTFRCHQLAHSIVEAFTFVTRNKGIDLNFITLDSYTSEADFARYLSSRPLRERLLINLAHHHFRIEGDIDYDRSNQRYSAYLDYLNVEGKKVCDLLDRHNAEVERIKQEHWDTITEQLHKQQQEHDTLVLKIVHQWNSLGLTLSPTKASVLQFINHLNFPPLNQLVALAEYSSRVELLTIPSSSTIPLSFLEVYSGSATPRFHYFAFNNFIASQDQLSYSDIETQLLDSSKNERS